MKRRIDEARKMRECDNIFVCDHCGHAPYDVMKL